MSEQPQPEPAGKPDDLVAAVSIQRQRSGRCVVQVVGTDDRMEMLKLLIDATHLVAHQKTSALQVASADALRRL